MKLGIFDKYKTVLSQTEHVKKFLDSKRPTAINFEIDLTNGCNHRCSFCQWGSWIQSNRATIKSEIITKTLPQLIKYGTKAITWTGGGEPTVHKDFFKLLNLSYRLGLENGLLTNGSLLTEEFDEQLLKQLVFLRISMAGGNRKAYHKVQGRDDFDLVINNLSRIGKLKRKLKSKTTLGVAFLANRENADSIEDFVETLIDSNCDYLQVRRDNYIKEKEKKWWADNIGKKCDELAKYTRKKGLDILSEGYVSSQKYVDYPTKCHAHFFVMAINAEGNVTFCKNTKDNPKVYIGNLYKKTFSDIWLSSKINQKLEKDIKPKNCATFCKNMQINTAIEDLMNKKISLKNHQNKKVLHKNFP